MEKTVPRLMTIRQVAGTGLLPEHTLRELEKQGRLPVLKINKKVYINYNKLIELIEKGEV